MRIVTLTVLLLSPFPALATAAEPSPPSPPVKAKIDCRTGPSVAVAPAMSRGVMQRLGDLPPATQIQTVYREVAGCPTPVVLRDGIGANAHLGRPPVSGTARIVPVR